MVQDLPVHNESYMRLKQIYVQCVGSCGFTRPIQNYYNSFPGTQDGGRVYSSILVGLVCQKQL